MGGLKTPKLLVGQSSFEKNLGNWDLGMCIHLQCFLQPWFQVYFQVIYLVISIIASILISIVDSVDILREVNTMVLRT